MFKRLCIWYLSRTAESPNTACFCPGCGINLTVNNSYKISYHGKVEYKCTNCNEFSEWLFDAPVPLLLSKERRPMTQPAYNQAIKERDQYKAKAKKLTEALELLRGHNQNNRAFGMYEIKVDSWIKKAIKEHGVGDE